MALPRKSSALCEITIFMQGAQGGSREGAGKAARPTALITCNGADDNCKTRVERGEARSRLEEDNSGTGQRIAFQVAARTKHKSRKRAERERERDRAQCAEFHVPCAMCHGALAGHTIPQCTRNV